MKPVRALILAVAMAAPAPALAADRLAGPVPATLLRVVDGDTLELRVQIWLDQELIVKARLAGVDAPELTRPGCPAERALAEQARDFVIRETAGEAPLVLSAIEHDKYAGRVVASVTTGAGQDLSAALLRSGLADIYGEGRDWCVNS